MADMGIGETMLLSAAMGGGSAALQGKDPLKGALMGGALGGLGYGLSSGIGSMFGSQGAIGEAAAGSQMATNEFTGELLRNGIDPMQYATTQIAQIPTTPYLTETMKQSMIDQMAVGADPIDTFKSAKFLASYTPPPTTGIAGLGTKAADWLAANPAKGAAIFSTAVPMVGSLMSSRGATVPGTEKYTGPLSFFKYDPRLYQSWQPTPPNPPYRAQYASGGIIDMADGGLPAPTGPVERMSQNIVGAGGMYPQSQMEKTYFATPTQMPASAEVVGADYDAKTNPYTGVMMAKGGIATKTPTSDDLEDLIDNAISKKQSGLQNKKDFLAQHNTALRAQGIAGIDLAHGGTADLGTYSDGGRMLKGPGDGMSDSIPGTIAGKRPARLADGEFVVPADVVSHLGNGSTDAGAKKLYGMMDRVRQARTGTKKQGRQINPNKLMPA